MTDTENITLSKILVLDLLRRAAPGAYLAEREELLRTIVELRRELVDGICPICHRPDSEHSLECPPEFTPRN